MCTYAKRSVRGYAVVITSRPAYSALVTQTEKSQKSDVGLDMRVLTSCSGEHRARMELVAKLGRRYSFPIDDGISTAFGGV